jgi:hypothetical protein
MAWSATAILTRAADLATRHGHAETLPSCEAKRSRSIARLFGDELRLNTLGEFDVDDAALADQVVHAQLRPIEDSR